MINFDIFDEKSLLIEELWNGPKALLLLQAQKKTGKRVVIITQDRTLSDDFGAAASEFPAWDVLPHEEILPSPDLVGRRLEILYEKPAIILASLQAILQKVPAPSSLLHACRRFKKGDEFPFGELPEYLLKLGYKRKAVAADKGEFALRGGIIDLFPLSSFDPYRIEFFGDRIEEIRTYDPIGQKSIEKVQQFFLSPAEEKDVSATLFDYLGEDVIVVFDDLHTLEDHYVAIQKFFPIEPLFARIKELPQIFLTPERMENLSEVEIGKRVGRAFYTKKSAMQPLSFEMFHKKFETKRWMHPFHRISDFFSIYENRAAATKEEIIQGVARFAKSPLHLRILCKDEAEERALKPLFHDLPSHTTFEIGYLSGGYVLPEENIALLPSIELTHRHPIRRPKWRSTYHTPAAEFHELNIGDLVVHFHHGIGKYLGMEKRPNHLGHLTEFLIIEFAEGSKLFVPSHQTHLVSRYIGSHEEIPSLHTLGGSRWQKTKEQTQKAIVGYAQELLKRHAERALHGGLALPPDSLEMESFERSFPFTETEDQLNAIADVKKDMMSTKSMDRLICGDVGYGKTEVAMRAAFKAVCDGKKQVAVLVPTTVLAQQHYETFSERMADFAINIGFVSRFSTARENKKTLERAKEGTLDILIGTHRIISKDVAFKDLGLIIIDEEQRFGVRAKEHLKTLKTGVDCLTLSATPIPRTLYMTLVGAREISIISTPPQDRLPIKTIIAEKDPALIQNALMRELTRDGQAFFIHNRVESMDLAAQEIQRLLPEAKVITGHGQMSSDELDTLFHAFKKGNADILVATTIVENGIDIPNANTIIIDRADQYGLADLYQLRGRVGRWNRPAFAYFLTPKNRPLNEIARKRLHSLVEASGYGGGMKVAMRDLEIRGAGDFLGEQQSGQVSSIGFHLYCKLLKRTIDALSKKSTPIFSETKMEFPYDARLPDDYISDTPLRLEIYHRFGDASSEKDTDDLLSELKDRFGAPPPPVYFLYHLTRIRILATQKEISLLKFDSQTLTVEKDKKRQLFALPRFKNPAELEARVKEIITQHCDGKRP